MANFTQYYDLEKPLPEEEYDIAVFNANADKIDAAIKNAGKELPPGLTMEYYGAAAPEGFLFCEGQAVSRTIYAKLFAVIGTQYGAGDGSTTFNLPDHRGRVGVGKSAEAEFNTLGKEGGTKTHTLTGNEIPRVGLQVQGSTFHYGGTTGNPGVNAGAFGTNVTNGPQITTLGGGASHNNIQPYITCNQVIKY